MPRTLLHTAGKAGINIRALETMESGTYLMRVGTTQMRQVKRRHWDMKVDREE